MFNANATASNVRGHCCCCFLLTGKGEIEVGEYWGNARVPDLDHVDHRSSIIDRSIPMRNNLTMAENLGSLR